MSTDDRHDDKPEFPSGDESAARADADATPSLPAFPGWQAPDAAAGTPGDASADHPSAAVPTTPAEPHADEPHSAEPAPRAVEIPEPIEMPAAEREPEAPASAETTATRDPLGGPYVVTESGAPVSGQATAAYDREPLGGPYVTSPEPVYRSGGDDTAAEDTAATDRARASSEAERATDRERTADPERTPYPAAAFAPAGVAAGATAASSASAAGGPAPVSTDYPPYQPVPQQVSAPQPPRAAGNRGAGILIALVGTVVFAAVYAVVSFFVIGANLTGDAAVSAFLQFLATAAFIVPVVVFALALILIVLIVNRAGWWAYVLGGFVVAVLVYFAGIAGALVHVQAWNWQPQEQYDFVRSLTMDPLTLAGAIVAREVSIWTGAWIALRGRRVKARNAAAREEFERSQDDERAAAERRTVPVSSEQDAPVTTW
jgi:hypothetical protein